MTSLIDAVVEAEILQSALYFIFRLLAPVYFQTLLNSVSFALIHYLDYDFGFTIHVLLVFKQVLGFSCNFHFHWDFIYVVDDVPLLILKLHLHVSDAVRKLLVFLGQFGDGLMKPYDFLVDFELLFLLLELHLDRYFIYEHD